MKKRNLIIISGVVAVFAIIFLIFMFGVQESVLNFGGITIEERKTINWNEIEVDLKAPYFGSLTSGAVGTFGDVTTYGSGLVICGDNDGKVSISNSYTSNNQLTLSSSISGRDGKGCAGNFIEAKMTVPAGVLSGACYLSAANIPQWKGASSSCSVHTFSYSINPAEGKSLSDSKEFNLIFDKPTTIIIRALPINVMGSSSSSRVTLEFTPLIIEEDKVIAYRFTNNTCNSIQIFSSEKTTNDYNTLEECQLNIEEEIPIVEEEDEIIEEEIIVECVQNIDCIEICEDKIPTCIDNVCKCDDKIPVIIIDEEEPKTYILEIILGLIILVLIIGIIILIKRRK